MPQRRLVVHVGAPKCGSTSLQAALSRRPEFRSRDGERYRYAAIAHDGAIMTGETLRRAAATSTLGYAVSANVATLEGLGEGGIGAIADGLNRLLADSSVVLSSEGWFERIGEFRRLGLLSRMAARVEIVAYLRPQAEFINASWWQWAVWSDIALDQWLARHDVRSCSWALMCYFWSLTEGVEAVHPRLKTDDVVADFFASLGCDAGEAAVLNRSLPAAALRFLQRNRELRPDAHDPEFDFVLARALSDWPERPPWVLPPGFVAQTIEQCLPDNLALKAMLPAAHTEIMSADTGWWEPSHYSDRIVEPAGVLAPRVDDVERLAVALAKALRDAGREIARLRDAATEAALGG